jgi:hypothetical protein
MKNTISKKDLIFRTKKSRIYFNLFSSTLIRTSEYEENEKKKKNFVPFSNKKKTIN